MDCSTLGFLVLHHLPEFAQTHAHWVSDAIQPSSSSVTPFSSCLRSFPASGSFPVSWLFISGSQSTGASASVSVLPMNIQGWCPLGLTGLISIQSKEITCIISLLTLNASSQLSRRHRTQQTNSWGTLVLKRTTEAEGNQQSWPGRHQVWMACVLNTKYKKSVFEVSLASPFHEL